MPNILVSDIHQGVLFFKHIYVSWSCESIKWSLTQNHFAPPSTLTGSNHGQGRNFVRDFCSTWTPSQLRHSAMLSALTTHCQWENETVRERTGHSPSYAEAKKMKSLTLHTHSCLGLA